MLSIGALQPGSFVDRYRIIRRLAVGGMAELYLACATGIEGFEKQVALKRILPQFACRPEFVGMFLDEARLAATLHHPNIAQVYDIGADAETYYFTMEFVDGADVRHIRKRAAALDEDVPLDHTVSITMGVAAGLHAAHEKRGSDGKSLGIVHRDVSPANVIVTYDGNVKLIDFGIAKAARRQTQTRTGILKGKSCNMSPEQCLAEPVDRRSDVFSLGILLYELSTGLRLFDGENEFETMRRIVAGRIDPPSRRCPEYPAGLEHIVMRALERDPDDRYQSAQEMFIELDCFAREERLAIGAYHLSAYVNRMFPERGDQVEAGASPPLFLLGDDAELPASLAAMVGAEPVTGDETADLDAELAVDVDLDDREQSAETRMDRAPTIAVGVHETTPGELEATIDRARSPALDPPSRPRSSPQRRSEPQAEPRRAELDSQVRRATTVAIGSRPRERRLPSEISTSLVKTESAARSEQQPAVSQRGIFRSWLSVLALLGSLSLAAAVLAYGLFAKDGWFATATIDSTPAPPATASPRVLPVATPVPAAVPEPAVPEPVVTRDPDPVPARTSVRKRAAAPAPEAESSSLARPAAPATRSRKSTSPTALEPGDDAVIVLSPPDSATSPAPTVIPNSAPNRSPGKSPLPKIDSNARLLTD
ncbi:MAG TPA: protein kinase [Kofleriaceae bacterium]|nr:protein kinase [Kofleriaceae bacterium]